MSSVRRSRSKRNSSKNSNTKVTSTKYKTGPNATNAIYGGNFARGSRLKEPSVAEMPASCATRKTGSTNQSTISSSEDTFDLLNLTPYLFNQFLTEVRVPSPPPPPPPPPPSDQKVSWSDCAYPCLFLAIGHLRKNWTIINLLFIE
jgi:hypothetical protein